MSTLDGGTDDGVDGRIDVGIGEYLRFFVASLRKTFILLVRYPVNTISQFGTIVIFFLLLFYGGRAVAPATLADSLSGLIVGYLLWTLALTAYSGLSWSITREAQWGTLEQLFMSPLGFGRVMAIKTVVNLLESALWGVATLAIMLLVTGRTLALDPLTVVPVTALAVAPAVGIGFVFGGLAIRFKRIENVFQLLQFVFIGLIAAPVGQYPVLKWLPLAEGSHLLRRAMADGVSITAMDPSDLGVLLVTAVGYLLVGYVVLQYCQRWARREGVMGHY